MRHRQREGVEGHLEDGKGRRGKNKTLLDCHLGGASCTQEIGRRWQSGVTA